MYNYITQPLFQQQRGGMFGAPMQPMGQPPMQGLPQMGGPLAQQPATPTPSGDDHHSKLHQMLPYLAMGLLPMLANLGGGGGFGQMASMISPLAFGLHKAKVF